MKAIYSVQITPESVMTTKYYCIRPTVRRFKTVKVLSQTSTVKLYTVIITFYVVQLVPDADYSHDGLRESTVSAMMIGHARRDADKVTVGYFRSLATSGSAAREKLVAGPKDHTAALPETCASILYQCD